MRTQKYKIKGQLKITMLLPIIYSIILVGILPILYFINRDAMIVMAIVAFVFLGFSIASYLFHRKPYISSMLDFGLQFAQVQKKILDDMIFPYGLMDSEGNLMWYNKKMASMPIGFVKNSTNMCNVFPELTEEILSRRWHEMTLEVSVNEQIYRMKMEKIEFGDSEQREAFVEVSNDNAYFVAFYLADETEIISLKREVDNKNIVSGLVYIDNYDEALANVENVRESLLVALVDRKINKFFTDANGIVRKLEKDKFFVVFEKRHLAGLMAERFAILEDVKTINTGNTLPITISVGLGLSGESFNQNCEFSRVAMDLALGRGGDQVVVKDGDKITYFGGNTESIDRGTRVKARVKAHALKELLADRDVALIMGHKLADMDCIGAAVGLYRAITSIGKKAYIVIETVTTTVQPMVERFNVTAGYAPDLFISGEKAKELMHDDTLLIIVDVNKKNYVECPELLEMAKAIVVLDHHRQSGDKIDNALLKYVEPYASSASELVSEIVQYFGTGIRLTQQEADALYAGIMIDTNNFMNKTGVRTFEAAAFLRKSGADITRVRKIFRDDLASYKTKAAVIRNAEVFLDYYAISICPSEGIDSPTVLASQAANEMLDIKGIRASFVFTEYREQVFISARSIDEVNVQIIMERLGGGGHMNMAGTQLKGCKVQEAIALLKETINGMVEEGGLK